jgi:hypothetical protein
VGDELLLECLPADARVVTVTDRYAFVEWPWREIDPASARKWNGLVAFPRDPDSLEWANTPWRLEPNPEELESGSTCRVGIPSTVVLVRSIRLFDPPRDLGWLPRPTTGLDVVIAGADQFDEDSGFLIYLDGAEPLSIALR